MSVTAERPQVFSDLELARRLERAEGRANAEFVEARAKLFPESGACWTERAGAYAMFDGATSPLTQTFGLGLFDTVTPADVEAIEEFFNERNAPVFHEVSPLAEAKTVALLNARGYEPFEFTSVMFRPLSEGVRVNAPNERIRVRLAGEGEQELWARTAAAGWGEFEELAEFMLELSEISARREGALSFLAELDGQVIATGGLFVSDGVALLAGASTIPEGRRRGAQLALLDARLRYAAERGCDLAMMCALPGSASQRNAERQGFRIAYTRVKWRLRRAAQGHAAEGGV
jgi:GNAT superfamily N-acetyltransferase